ncbi:MAG: AAA family ATPase, partial [Nakamurella sp.]
MDPREPLLIGRTDEVATLTAHLRAAVTGSGRVVVIEGEPGVGKSRLVQVIAELSADNGLSVHIGRAHHQEVERTLGATLDAFGMRLDDLAGKSAATRMVLESDAPAAARFLLVDRLLQVLDERCELTPVLLVIEDLHWADPATLAWVRAAAEHVATLPLLLVLTTRPMRAPTPLRQLLDELPGDRLMLAALSRSDATALARRVYGHEPDGTLQDAVHRASGNPMLVIAASEAAAAGSAPGPRSISARLAELDQRAIAALQTAAVLGESVHPVELAAVIGGRIADLLVDLHHCAGAGFLVQRDDRMVFRHDLHQRAVLESLTPAARQLLHLDAARSLARSGAPAVDVAEHYARGALPGDRQAVAWLQQAASDIVVTAPAGALRLVDIARGLCESSPPVGLLLVQVRALASSGRIADAETLGLSLLRDGLDPSVESGLRRELAFTALMRGDRLQSVSQIERCAALITDPSAATRVHG